MATSNADLVERLREACVGYPHAKIAWPHRILHEAAAAITALEAERDRLAEVVCPDCGRHVLAHDQPATGFIAKCGRRLTRLEECRNGGCASDAQAAPEWG